MVSDACQHLARLRQAVLPLVSRGSVINRKPHRDLLRSEKPPRMACIQARYSRRHIHDHSAECPCPIAPSCRAHPEPTATAPPPGTAHRLLGEALLEGSGNHDRKEAAYIGWESSWRS